MKLPHEFVECSFLIPVCRDSDLSDGAPHSAAQWEWLRTELRNHFGAGTEAPGLYVGFYTDPETGRFVSDESRRYMLAVTRRRISKVRDLLRRACVVFHQKCIYLSVAGKVEFIEHPKS